MDEPTNFLDLVSVDSLIAASRKYKGALMLVSHNRFFLNKCAQQYLSIVPGQFNLYNELQKCERATYSFIQDLEEGTGVDTQNLIKKPTDAASVGFSKGGSGSTETVASANTSVTTSASGAKVISIKSSGIKPTVKVAAKPVAAAPAAADPKAKAAPAKGNKK